MSKDLSNFDFVVAIDKSGSMASAGTRGKSRWVEAQETTLGIASKAAQFDSNGITVIPFSGSHKVYDQVTADKVGQVFAENDPSGSTNTAGMLQTVFDRFTADPDRKPVLLVIVTDGEPDDREAVKTVIRNFAETLVDNGEGDTDEFGILFLQIGDDAGATKFLVDLDDNLNAKFDIVDAKTAAELENMSLTDAFLQALEG